MFRGFALSVAVLAAGASSGCLSPGSPTPPDSAVSLGDEDSTSKPTLKVADGAKAVRIIFKNEDPGGSFFISSSDMDVGTSATSTNGLKVAALPAVRLFNPDNSLLSDRRNDINNPDEDSEETWPAWFKNFEVTITGDETAHNVQECARFAKSTEGSAINCAFDGGGDGSGDKACGAPQNVYRVSERDCSYTAAGGTSVATSANGTGGPNDPVQFRLTLDRGTDVFEDQENLMVVLEYAASSYNGGPQEPTDCFDSSTGKFTLTAGTCTDSVWQVFIKGSISDLVPPFVLLAPPFYASVNTTAQTGGSGVASRQFTVPLASYPDAKVIQFSRMSGIQTSTPNRTTIQGDCPSNSPLCVGMVFYSITFFRI